MVLEIQSKTLRDQLPDRFRLEDPVLINIFYTTLVFIVIFVLARLINRLLGGYIKNNSTRYTARKFISFSSYVIFIIVAMVIFNYRLSSLTLALGVAGAGIAFALQEVIVSIAGFLAIIFGNFYKVGDRVQLGGVKGDVVDIGILRTTVMEIGDWVNGDLYNGKMVRVANSFIFKEPVSNYSGDFPFLWDEIAIPLKQSSDHQYAQNLFSEILLTELGEFAKSCEQSWSRLTKELYVENAQIKPMINMSFDENWITFTLRYVVDFKKRRGTKDLLFKKILESIRESKGKLEIASAAMEITTFNGSKVG